MIISQAVKDQWAGEPCTLDDRPAKIVGRLLPFARVAPLDPDKASVEFAWETVDRIMRTDGAFRSH